MIFVGVANAHHEGSILHIHPPHAPQFALKTDTLITEKKTKGTLIPSVQLQYPDLSVD